MFGVSSGTKSRDTAEAASTIRKKGTVLLKTAHILPWVRCTRLLEVLGNRVVYIIGSPVPTTLYFFMFGTRFSAPTARNLHNRRYPREIYLKTDLYTHPLSRDCRPSWQHLRTLDSAPINTRHTNANKPSTHHQW